MTLIKLFLVVVFSFEQFSNAISQTNRPQKENSFNTIIFTRVAEPKEKAFTLLLAKGWQIEGGIFRVNPALQGGPPQSIAAKLDFSIKKDAAGTWGNKETMLPRAPSGEFPKWEPVFSIITNSIQINPQWIAGEIQGQIERGKIALNSTRSAKD